MIKSEQTQGQVFTPSTQFSFQSDMIWFWHCVPHKSDLRALLLLLVDRIAEQCLACGRPDLTLGQRLPYCGLVYISVIESLLSLSACPPHWSTEGCGLVYFSHNSVSVINTSTDPARSIDNNIPVWPVGWCGGWQVSHDLLSLLPASVVVGLSLSQIIENRTMSVISEVIIKELVSYDRGISVFPQSIKTHVSLN